MPRDPQSTASDERRRGSSDDRRRRPRLDQPSLPRRRLSPFPEYDPESFGRMSERIARFLGTGRFLVYMTATVVAWIGWNVVVPASLRFDEYPFIFLTLALSLQASYAAPLILLAQNRQDDRDRVNLEQDRARNERNIADTEYLTREVASLRIALGEVATRDFLRSELQALVKELDDRRETDSVLSGGEPGSGSGSGSGGGSGGGPDDGGQPPRRGTSAGT